MNYLRAFLIISAIAAIATSDDPSCFYEFESDSEMEDFDSTCDGLKGEWRIEDVPDSITMPDGHGDKGLTIKQGSNGCLQSSKKLTLNTTTKVICSFYWNKAQSGSVDFKIKFVEDSTHKAANNEWDIAKVYGNQIGEHWFEASNDFTFPKIQNYKLQIMLYLNSATVLIDSIKILDIAGNSDQCYVHPRATTTEFPTTTTTITTEVQTTTTTTEEATTTTTELTTSTTEETTTTTSTAEATATTTEEITTTTITTEAQTTTTSNEDTTTSDLTTSTTEEITTTTTATEDTTTTTNFISTTTEEATSSTPESSGSPKTSESTSTSTITHTSEQMTTDSTDTTKILNETTTSNSTLPNDTSRVTTATTSSTSSGTIPPSFGGNVPDPNLILFPILIIISLTVLVCLCSFGVLLRRKRKKSKNILSSPQTASQLEFKKKPKTDQELYYEVAKEWKLQARNKPDCNKKERTIMAI